MTVRIRQIELDTRRLAAILTPVLLSPARDDAPTDEKVGVAWLRWGDANLWADAHLN